ncbi:MAG: suppressor of fused domain protein [Lysinibacillus sp.]
MSFLRIASSYDELGNRSQITSSLGALIDVTRNEMGNVSDITASRADQAQWTVAMQYNELGQEIERILPGDVISKWQYDVTGRPTQHRISSQNRHTRRRVYNWDVNHRLKSMVNELTGVRTTYGYDEFSNLVWSNQGGQFDFLHRNVDEVGNLYETKENKDRVYGAGSRLLETTEATFSYDDEGNLVQKEEKNGATWKYEYNGNGMMSKVIKPDNTEVTFKYDSLGRRIEKHSDEKTIQFVWDGNTILHEYFLNDNSEKSESVVEDSSQNNSEIPDNLVTWVFNDGFVPSAKITSEGNYSIISDYLGTPVEAFDGEGHKVWAAGLDVYGRVEEFTGVYKGVKKMINYGELYYDHYNKFLGEPVDQEVFKNNEEMPSIQILKYENVFEECLVYNTLGFSNYEEIVGDNVEVSMVVDATFNSMGKILANALFYCIGNQMEIGRGIAICGIESIDKTFVQNYDKSAIYFTEPFAFPKKYSEVRTETKEKDGRMLLAFFISQSEYEYFVENGTEKFEDLLEEKNVDPFMVSRISAV